MQRKEDNKPLSISEAHKLTIDRMEDFIKVLNDKVKEKGWVLTQGRYDAIFDMYWNAGDEIFKYKATELLATGDLTDETVIKDLEREILETAYFTDDDNTWWSKNLVERRLDVVLIAQGGKGAYKRHESLEPVYWNESGADYLIEKGIDSEKVHQTKFSR